MSESARSGNAHQQTIRSDRKHQDPRIPKDTKLDIPNHQQGICLSCRLPTFPKPSTASDRLDLHTVSNGPGLGRHNQPPFDDPSQHLEASRRIFSSQCIRTGIRLIKPMQSGFFSLRIFCCPSPTSSTKQGQRPTPIVRRACAAQRQSRDSVSTKAFFSKHRIGGAERDRTADPLLAKQVLSQLSYSPNL